jgi:hypothetical protein
LEKFGPPVCVHEIVYNKHVVEEYHDL